MNSSIKYLTFLYHEAVDDPSESGFQRKSALPYKHSIGEFYANIDIIVKKCKNIITINSLDEYQQATLLTFDDGGKSAMLIAEYLEKNNIRGHFFITTNLIGDKYFLSRDEVLELHERGHLIGSHSHSHPNVFRSLSYDEMISEWQKSKMILEDIIKENVKICSIPGGDANKNAYLSARECGFEVVFDFEPILEPRRMRGLLILGRICPKAGTNYERIEKYCEHRGVKKDYFIRTLKNALKYYLFPLYRLLINRGMRKY